MFITNKNISESLVRSLQNSFTSQSNCEITLMCEGKTLKCHRHVLVLHSSHFSNLFKDQNNYPTCLAVVNMKFAHLKAMVDYMYFGRIKLQEDSAEMQQIVKCAEDLGLSALVNFITEYLKNYGPIKPNQVNGNSANLSANEVNGDDSLVKRKRVSEISSRTLNDSSFKKPKPNEEPISQSTPLREHKITLAKVTDGKTGNSLDNSESLVNDKKRKSDDDDADDEESNNRKAKEKEEENRKKKLKEEEEQKKRKHEEEEKKRREEEERKRKEAENQKLEAERRRKLEEEKRKAEEVKRKAEEAERIRAEEEKKKKALEKKREEEAAAAAAAKKLEEERSKKETTKCDESASTKSCAICNKQYKDGIDHSRVLEGVVFEKKCIVSNCSKPLKFRRSLIDHLFKEHKIDVCDG